MHVARTVATEMIAAAIVGLIVAFASDPVAGLLVALALGIAMLLVTVAVERRRRHVPLAPSRPPVGYGSVGFKTRTPGRAEFIGTKATGPMAIGYDTEAGWRLATTPRRAKPATSAQKWT
jgi:hypothetical protein